MLIHFRHFLKGLSYDGCTRPGPILRHYFFCNALVSRASSPVRATDETTPSGLMVLAAYR